MDDKGIPEDVHLFFKGRGGHSLIVKGSAGTGKTTLALQLIEELEDIPGGYYLSIRVSDESLYNQFPWLREKVRRSELMKVGRGFLRSFEEADEEEMERIKQARSLLREVSEDEVRVTRVDRTELSKMEGRLEMGQEGDEIYEKVGEGEVVDNSLVFDLGSDLPEIDIAYDAIDRNLPRKSLLIIDSIDALSERYGIHPAKLINTVQKDLVESSNTNVVYILESKGGTKLDYLGDGVIELVDKEVHGRRLRIMLVEKLRGREIKQHKYVFTLKEGRVKCFSYRAPQARVRPRRWKPVADKKRCVSTGNEDLDELIGMLERGSIMSIQVDVNVPSDFIDPLLLAFVSNFCRLKRGVAFVPPGKSSADFIRENMTPYTGKKYFDASVRVFESSPLGSLEGSRNALQMEGSSVETDLKWSIIEYHLGEAKHPFLSLMAFDTLEAVYGENVASQMTSHFSSIRKSKDIFVGLTSPTCKSAGTVANMSTVHLRVENVDGCILLFGEKPYTGFHNLAFDWSEGYPKAVITQIV
ncbi:MAG: gas vesicle protein GvpD P-loop domain-containing protein [Thermoplasmata archaeon]